MKCRKVVYSVISEESLLGLQYGIVCEENGREYLTIKDISSDRETVEKLASACNAGELSANQFKDVVEDSLL